MSCISVSVKMVGGHSQSATNAIPTMVFSAGFVCPIVPTDRPILQTSTGDSFETLDGNYIMLQ